MSLIKTSVHKKFVSQCHALINSTEPDGQNALPEDKVRQLQEHLDELQQLFDYQVNAISKLLIRTEEYNILQRRIRLRLRKMKLVKNKNTPEK